MYDLAIVGAGAGGIAAAKLALKLGLKTVLIDREQDSFGGTCINRGCIPTKFFLNLAKASKQWGEIFSAKPLLIEKIKSPLLKYLLGKGLVVTWGEARFFDNHTIFVDEEKIEAKSFIIAAGSLPCGLVGYPNAVLAENIFALDNIPQKVIIAGAGYIGIEIASLLNALGADVTIAEMQERILFGFDARLANRFRIILETKGIKINTGKTLDDFSLDEFGLVVMALGRKPDLAALNLLSAGVKVNEKGWIATDKYMHTNVDNIFACGDCTGKMMLAYTAEYQAELCVKNITRGPVGALTEENYHSLATSVFSFPQIAHTGASEEILRDKGVSYRLIKSNFLKFSSAYVYNDTDGYMQIIIDDNGVILGADIISEKAAELIALVSVAIAGKMNVRQLKDCLLVHPTLSEIIPLMLRDEC
jgi:glutathione reductase (NADPH)